MLQWIGLGSGRPTPNALLVYLSVYACLFLFHPCSSEEHNNSQEKYSLLVWVAGNIDHLDHYFCIKSEPCVTQATDYYFVTL